MEILLQGCCTYCCERAGPSSDEMPTACPKWTSLLLHRGGATSLLLLPRPTWASWDFESTRGPMCSTRGTKGWMLGLRTRRLVAEGGALSCQRRNRMAPFGGGSRCACCARGRTSCLPSSDWIGLLLRPWIQAEGPFGGSSSWIPYKQPIHLPANPNERDTC